MICEDLDGPLELQDIATNDPGAQYNMGKSQKFPVHIPTFLQRNEGDPAIKVSSFSPSHLSSLIHLRQNFFSKLRDHLLPRVQLALQQEAASLSEHTSTSTTSSNTGSPISLN